MKKGLLLVNLGTTSAPRPKETGEYLREFLMDPKVIDIPWFWRWILVHLLIVPRRKYISAHAYEQIWRKEGSPLLYFSERLCEGLKAELGRHQTQSQWQVDLAMRYGQPSIVRVLQKLKSAGVEDLFVLPLYPHFAESSTGTAWDKVKREMETMAWTPKKVRVLPYFFSFPDYIELIGKLIIQELSSFHPNHILFSYHGLPERHILQLSCSFQKGMKKSCELNEQCCSIWNKNNEYCYRAQCFETSRLIQQNLQQNGFFSPTSTAFQSRLGRSKWIGPSIEAELENLIQKDVRRLIVVCPSFVTDCLETLEEVGVRMRDLFVHLGGQDLRLVPCLNDHSDWIKVLASWCDNQKRIEMID